MPPTRATHRARILRVLDAASEGLTCKQIERMTGIRHATASAALSGMADQSLVFRLDGFRKPFHWVTPGNLRGRATLPKPLSRKDRQILDLKLQITELKLVFDIAGVDYPTDRDTVSPEQVVEPLQTEMEQSTLW